MVETSLAQKFMGLSLGLTMHLACRPAVAPSGVSGVLAAKEPTLAGYSTPEAGSAAGDPPTLIEVNEKTGRPRQHLILRLDYFADIKANRKLPSCSAPIDREVEIGFIVCDGKSGSRIPLMANMVDQVCYTNAKAKRTLAQEVVVITGCRQAKAILHAFKPGVRLDVEHKDL